MLTTGKNKLARKTATVIKLKFVASPRKLPNNPIIRQLRIITRFGPNRSFKLPATRLEIIRGKELAPQTTPAWTRLRFKSVEISGKSTDRLIPGTATTIALVNVPRARINHLVFEFLVLFIILV
jgi:hypothetical protein